MRYAVLKFLFWLIVSTIVLLPGTIFRATAHTVGTVKVALASNPGSYIRNIVLEPLVVIKKGRIKPMLATEWQWKHPQLLEIRLRTGVNFHDGSAFNATAVKANFDYFKTSVLPIKARREFKDTRCDIVDARTVRFALATPDSLLLHKLSRLYQIAPAQLQLLKKSGGYTWGTVPGPGDWGTGPFRLESGYINLAEWSSEIVLEAFPGYWSQSYPKVGKIVVNDLSRHFKWPLKRSFGMALDAVMEKEGELDIVPASHLITLNIAKSKYAQVRKIGRSTMIGLINMRKTNSIWKDIRLRKAINMAVNRDFLKSVMKGNAEITPGLVPPGYLGHNPGLQPYAYDPDGARLLVRAAGYKDDIPIKIILPFKTQKIVPMLKEMFAAAGFSAEFVPMGIHDLSKRYQLIHLDQPMSEQNWDVCIIKHQGSTDHPYLDIYRRYFARDGLLRWIADDRELYGLIQRFEDIRDEKQQDLILQRFEALQHTKAYMLGLYSLPNTYALNKQIRLSSEVTNDQFILRELELLPDHWSLRP